jgi:hypothetical protein
MTLDSSDCLPAASSCASTPSLPTKWKWPRTPIAGLFSGSIFLKRGRSIRRAEVATAQMSCRFALSGSRTLCTNQRFSVRAPMAVKRLGCGSRPRDIGFGVASFWRSKARKLEIVVSDRNAKRPDLQRLLRATLPIGHKLLGCPHRELEGRSRLGPLPPK